MKKLKLENNILNIKITKIHNKYRKKIEQMKFIINIFNIKEQNNNYYNFNENISKLSVLPQQLPKILNTTATGNNINSKQSRSFWKYENVNESHTFLLPKLCGNKQKATSKYFSNPLFSNNYITNKSISNSALNVM